MAQGFTTKGGWFIDPHGRHTLMRGVNLGGSTKMPFTPNGATHLGVDFEGWREVSFIGRPAPLDEIDRHLDRIAHWGFNILRFLVTWEAIEHEGPGLYDEAYLDYVREVVQRAAARGLYVFIDPHHDVWSRWTGGDGAPFWCFELAGLVPEKFVATDAVELNAFDWPANYNRVPVATMWTLFYAGDAFCPALRGVQEQLQAHYLGAIKALAGRLADIDHVLGYDSLNEPSNGYLGRGTDLMRRTRMFDRGDNPLKPFSPVEYLAAADGHTIRHDDGGVLNEVAASIWDSGCPWREAGVWDFDADGKPTLRNDTYFTELEGNVVRPFADFMVPAIDRFRREIRDVHPDAMIFIEGSPTDNDLEWHDPDPRIVNARHWYDVTMLFTRRFDPDHYENWFSTEPMAGAEAIGENYAMQIGWFTEHSRTAMSDAPLLLGEFGVTYEMNDGEAFRTGDYRAARIANEAMYHALDRTLAHSTQWNYTADNTHERGDQWNEEDLSIFSADDQHDPDDLDSGGRGTEGFCRPRVLHAAGRPTAQSFDPSNTTFVLTIEADEDVAAASPTEVYVPRLHYPHGAVVAVTGGDATFDADRQRVVWTHPGVAGDLTLTITRP
jgi:hypothetical protein